LLLDFDKALPPLCSVLLTMKPWEKLSSQSNGCDSRFRRNNRNALIAANIPCGGICASVLIANVRAHTA
jgi:hypothetical protein